MLLENYEWFTDKGFLKTPIDIIKLDDGEMLKAFP